MQSPRPRIFYLFRRMKNIYIGWRRCMYERIAARNRIMQSNTFAHTCAVQKYNKANARANESSRASWARTRIIAVGRIQWADCELREAREGLTPRRLITSFLPTEVRGPWLNAGERKFLVKHLRGSAAVSAFSANASFLQPSETFRFYGPRTSRGMATRDTDENPRQE